jgi:hypothetical protein
MDAAARRIREGDLAVFIIIITLFAGKLDA